MIFDLNSYFSISTRHPLCEKYRFTTQQTLCGLVRMSQTRGGVRSILDARRKYLESWNRLQWADPFSPVDAARFIHANTLTAYRRQTVTSKYEKCNNHAVSRLYLRSGCSRSWYCADTVTVLCKNENYVNFPLVGCYKVCLNGFGRAAVRSNLPKWKLAKYTTLTRGTDMQLSSFTIRSELQHIVSWLPLVLDVNQASLVCSFIRSLIHQSLWGLATAGSHSLIAVFSSFYRLTFSPVVSIATARSTTAECHQATISFTFPWYRLRSNQARSS